MDRMIIKSSEPIDNLGISGEGLITSMGIKAKTIPNKQKKSRYAIVNFSMKDLSKSIREFEKLSCKIYERRRPKHKPNESYFYPARNITKCTMRAYALNSHVYPVRT